MVDDGYSRDGAFDREVWGDLTALSGEDLRGELASLGEEERALASRQEFLRGRIALIRAELAGRNLATVPAEQLARVLLGEERGRGGS